MPLSPDSPCHEQWSSLTPNGDGRFCQKCDKTVVDMTQLTRRQAEKLVLAAGGNLCGRLRVAPNGAPVFRPEPPQKAGLLSAATMGLLAACGSTTDAETSSTPSTLASVEDHAPEVTTGGDHLLGAEPPSGSLASPMMPLEDDRDVAPLPEGRLPEAPVTGGATVVAAVVEEEGEVAPTPDQLTLTAEKEEGREDRARPAGRRRRHRDTVAASTDPAPTATGRRNNGSHAATASVPPATGPGPAVNNPPPVMFMGGISYTP